MPAMSKGLTRYIFSVFDLLIGPEAVIALLGGSLPAANIHIQGVTLMSLLDKFG